MGWHRFTNATYRVMAVVFLLFVAGATLYGCFTGEMVLGSRVFRH